MWIVVAGVLVVLMAVVNVGVAWVNLRQARRNHVMALGCGRLAESTAVVADKNLEIAEGLWEQSGRNVELLDRSKTLVDKLVEESQVRPVGGVEL